MAFMMPVMKNNYDIFKDSRSRKTSDCSNISTNIGAGTSNGQRSRKSSDCKSESFASSPSHHHAYRMQMQRCQSSRAFSRSANSPAAGAMSPTRSFCQTSSPPKTSSTSGNGNGNGNGNCNGVGGSGAAAATGNGSQNDLSKFHLRLVEKLRKSFRKDSAKRS